MKWLLSSLTALALSLTVAGAVHAQSSPLSRPQSTGRPGLIVEEMTRAPFSNLVRVRVRNDSRFRVPGRLVELRVIRGGILEERELVRLPVLEPGRSRLVTVRLRSVPRPGSRLLLAEPDGLGLAANRPGALVEPDGLQPPR
jgi:hypothetical protein